MIGIGYVVHLVNSVQVGEVILGTKWRPTIYSSGQIYSGSLTGGPDFPQMVVVGLVRDMGPRKFQEDPAVGDVYEGANTNLHEFHWHPGWEVLPQVGPFLGPKTGSPTPFGK